MKKNKIIYWIATSIAMLTGGLAGFFYLIGNPMMKEAFIHLGYPDYFRIELGIAKIIGMIVLLFSSIPSRTKEWAYVGFAITFISAIVANANIDGLTAAFPPLIPLLFLTVSYVYYQKLKTV